MPNKDAGKIHIRAITWAGSCPKRPADIFCAAVTDRVNVTPAARWKDVLQAPSPPRSSSAQIAGWAARTYVVLGYLISFLTYPECFLISWKSEGN